MRCDRDGAGTTGLVSVLDDSITTRERPWPIPAGFMGVDTEGTHEWETTFAAHWPNASQQEQDLAQPLNERPEYVASTTLIAPLAWQNSTLLTGDLVAAVAKLTADDGDVHVIGSPQLVRYLTAQGLIDEYRIMLDPLLLGGGQRYFPDYASVTALRLLDSRVTPTGAILATYATTRE
jgi:dihydrofolate reductase